MSEREFFLFSQVPYEGPLVLVILLTLFQGFTGMALGMDPRTERVTHRGKSRSISQSAETCDCVGSVNFCSDA